MLLLSIVILALALLNRRYADSQEAIGVAIALCAVGILASWVLRVPGIVEWWQSRPAGADAPVSGSFTLATFLTPIGAMVAIVGGLLVIPGRDRRP
ncbi:hypothetical protein D7Y13_44855 [Corallococcus praedator]|uniref:CvpA family protein n=1 Tax=Corallococcus praedator TaxID=2316724 RepID=A0ABX9Q1S4_9BACT|nr:hypothetical protein D7Y13_44855 [Corallococcus praedator]